MVQDFSHQQNHSLYNQVGNKLWPGAHFYDVIVKKPNVIRVKEMIIQGMWSNWRFIFVMDDETLKGLWLFISSHFGGWDWTWWVAWRIWREDDWSWFHMDDHFLNIPLLPKMAILRSGDMYMLLPANGKTSFRKWPSESFPGNMILVPWWGLTLDLILFGINVNVLIRKLYLKSSKYMMSHEVPEILLHPDVPNVWNAFWQFGLLPGKLTCPLKINGWKIYFPLK